MQILRESQSPIFFSVMSYEIREGLVDIKRIIISKNVRRY